METESFIRSRVFAEVDDSCFAAGYPQELGVAFDTM
jgi:hypothetical protein